jgi:WD40 repeat protein
MSASILRRGAVALLVASTVSCEISTGPDGGTPSSGFSLLVQRRNTAGERSFHVMSSDGNQIRPFVGAPSDAVTLIPSPDGKTIAYRRLLDAGYVELWAMDRDGANRRPLLSGGTWFVESATWSPDGKKLALAVSDANHSNDIATMNADGTDFVYLTSDPLPGILVDRDPSWSPDGTRIAFSSNAAGVTRLWIMNADGGNAHQVLPTSFPSNEQHPVWAPDTSDVIAVVSNTAAGTGIAFVRADGSDFHHVPINPAPVDPFWLPDGRLLYVASVAGDHDLWTVDRATGETRPFITSAFDDIHAAVFTDVAPFAWLGFATPVTYQINRPGTAVAIADIITDARPDVLVLSPIINEVHVMKGLPGGALQPIGGLFSESDVGVIQTGNVSNDTAPDLVGVGDSAVFVWRGGALGPGISLRIPLLGAVRGAALADLDNSGRAEIVSLVENGTQPFHLKTHRLGANDNIVLAADLATTRTVGHSVCGGDVTGDGFADIVAFAGSSNLSAYLAEGRGDLGLTDLRVVGTSLTSDLQAVPFCADFNNDGKTDIALFSAGAAQSVSVYRFGSLTFGTANRINASASGIAIADIDRDGDLDVILASASSATILIARNRGNGTFDAPTPVDIPSIPVSITAGDLNGDDWPDIALIDATGALVVLFSRGRAGMN